MRRHVPIVIAALTVVAVRWWTSRAREVVHMTPDEPGQLAIARFVGRGLRWNMFDHSTWRPAYGTLIAPITWFTDDPTTMYRSALAVNAVLGGASCVLLACLARRLTKQSSSMCAALAAVVSLSPALLLTTNWVWSEALVQVTFLAFLLAALRVAETASRAAGVTMVVAAALGFATHSRLLVLAVTATAVVVFLAARRRISVRRAAALLALLVVSIVAVARFSQFVVDRVWDEPAPTNTAGGVLSRVGRVGPLARSALGQVWYQLVTTVGLAGLGTIALVRAALRRARPPLPRDARVVLATVLPVVALSIVFMTDRWRPDHIVYGRYNDVALAPVVVVGLATVRSSTRRRLLVDGGAVLAAIAVLGLLLWATSDNELQAGGLLRMMVLGLLPFVQGSRLDVAAVSAAAGLLIAAVLGVMVMARRGRTRIVVGAVLIALLLSAGYRRARPVVDNALNAWARASAVQEVADGLLPRGADVRNRIVADSRVATGAQRQRAMLYEFYLPFNTMYREGGEQPDEPSPYVFAPVDDAELIDRGADVLWRDPTLAIALWHDPG